VLGPVRRLAQCLDGRAAAAAAKLRPEEDRGALRCLTPRPPRDRFHSAAQLAGTELVTGPSSSSLHQDRIRMIIRAAPDRLLLLARTGLHGDRAHWFLLS